MIRNALNNAKKFFKMRTKKLFNDDKKIFDSNKNLFYNDWIFFFFQILAPIWPIRDFIILGRDTLTSEPYSDFSNFFWKKVFMDFNEF